MRLRIALMGAATALALAPAAYAAGRGTDGTVNILYWQAPSIMNPYLSGGTKDVQASSLVLEPLAGYDQKGRMFPRLAQDIVENQNRGHADDEALKGAETSMKHHPIVDLQNEHRHCQCQDVDEQRHHQHLAEGRRQRLQDLTQPGSRFRLPHLGK